MAIRIDTAFQAIYAWEAEGHTIPALNTALSAGGPMRIEGPTTDESLVCGFYGVSTGTLNYWALIKNAGSNNVELRGYNGSLVTSGTYDLSPGQYHVSIEHDSGTVRARLDGVVILSMAFSPLAGTAGDRSFQIGGYGEAAGIIDCTVERWRMWSGLLSEAQWRDEFRSEVPVRTVGLLHDWPMAAGSGRLNDTVAGEPDMSENTAVPVGDGTAITLHPSLYGAPQFFNLGDSATPGAQTVTVPQFAKAVAIHIFATDDTVPDVDVTSVTSNFTGSFTLDNITASATSAGGAIATALVQSYGSNRSFTIVMDAANGLAGAGAWVSFIQDVPDSFVTGTDHGEASGDGTTPGVASASGVNGGLALASDTRLDAGSGNYPANQSGWTSLAVNQSGPGGTIGYYGPSRLRQKAITATGTETATSQTTFASIVSLLTLEPSPALATVAPTAPVVESGDVTNSGNNTASTSWAVSHPAAVAGDMLIFNLAWDDSTTVSSVTAPAGPNGETAVSIAGPVASNGTEVRAQAWRYIATGSWSAGTRTFTPAASEQWTASVLKVPAGEFDATTPIGAASTAASAGVAESSALSPAYSLGSSDGGGRLVSWLVADDDPFDAQATGWTNLANVDRGATVGCLAARDLQTSDSESVAAGTWRIAGDSWCSLAYVIRKASNVQTLSPPLLTNSNTLYAPTVTRGAVSLSPGLLTNVSTLYAPTITSTYTLQAPLLTNGQTFYAPTVTVGAVSLAPPLLTNTSTVYEPTVTQASGSQNLTPSLLVNTSTVYGPTVTPGSVSLAPPLLSNVSTVFEPTVTSRYTLTAPLLTNANTLYAPSVSVGGVTLTPSLVVNSSTLFAPTVVPGSVVISPALLTNVSTVYPPTVVQMDPGMLYPPLLVNDSQVFAPQVVNATSDANLTRAAPGLTPKIWPSLWIRYEDRPKKRIERLEEEERERIEEIAEQAVIEAANERTKKAMRESLQASMRAAEIELAAGSYLRLVEQAAALRMEQIEEEDMAVVLALM